MKVLAIASRKGGVGKTTFSGHLSVEATKAGYGTVALIDTDPQGSLSLWWNERKAETPLFVTAVISNLAEQLKELAKAGVDLVIIDTPPAVTEIIDQVLTVADLVLIPTRPSPHDLRAIGSTVEMVEAHDKKMVFVINGAAARAKITGEAAIALSQYGMVAPVTVFQRTDFASSMISGLTASEVNPGSKSAMEIAELWKYIEKQLRKIKAK
jgi:chromosome partitioning protein